MYSKHQQIPPMSYDTPQKLQEYLNSFDPSTPLYLSAEIDFILAKFGHSLFENIDFPQVKYLGLNYIKNLESLQYFKFPDSLTELVVRTTGLKSLIGVKFPPNLIRLRLDYNQIKFLAGVEFPSSLKKLDLTNNKINSLNGVTFPSNLTELQLSNNEITSLFGAQFPPNLVRLTLRGNPIASFKGIIDPSPNVIVLIEDTFPMQVKFLYEKLASKAARQSQKAEFKRSIDSSQQFMQNQLKAVTSFLREGMEIKAQQHAEQLVRDKPEKPTTYEESLFYAKLNEKTYPVPMNEEMSIQAVLNYLNENYYIAVLHSCDGMHLRKPGVGKLDSGRTLKDCGVVSEEVLDIVCETQKGGVTRRHYRKRIKSKRIKSKRNNSKRNKSKKNGHKHK